MSLQLTQMAYNVTMAKKQRKSVTISLVKQRCLLQLQTFSAFTTIATNTYFVVVIATKGALGLLASFFHTGFMTLAMAQNKPNLLQSQNTFAFEFKIISS